jgi:hypothetical protein
MSTVETAIEIRPRVCGETPLLADAPRRVPLTPPRRRRIGSRIEAHGLPHGLPRASLRPFEGPSKRAPVPES